jgi:hypothetical protein
MNTILETNPLLRAAKPLTKHTMNITLQAISNYLTKHGILNYVYNYIGIPPQNPEQQPFNNGRQHHLIITHDPHNNTIKLENNYHRYIDSNKYQTYYKVTDYSTTDPNLLQQLLQNIQKAQDQYA